VDKGRKEVEAPVCFVGGAAEEIVHNLALFLNIAASRDLFLPVGREGDFLSPSLERTR
jgi:hypothetical protein